MIIKKYKLGSILINKLAIQNIKEINHNPYNDIINDKDRRFLFVSDKNRIIKYQSNTKKNINNVYEVLWLYNISNFINLFLKFFGFIDYFSYNPNL